MAVADHERNIQIMLLRVAYLMGRAKKEEGSACGGDSHAIVVAENGAIASVDVDEMERAEVLSHEIERHLTHMFHYATSGIMEKRIEAELHGSTQIYRHYAKSVRELLFPSLRQLDHPIPRRQKTL